MTTIEHQIHQTESKSPYHCEHDTLTQLRKRTYSNGSTHYIEQCLTCGTQLKSYKRDSNEVAQARLNGTIPEFDESIQKEFEARARATYTDSREAWFSEYNEYLKSDAWAKKRVEVLRRDQYICQGCRKRQATTVHHLSYQHLGNEFLFELVSLCQPCHDRIHEK